MYHQLVVLRIIIHLIIHILEVVIVEEERLEAGNILNLKIKFLDIELKDKKMKIKYKYINYIKICYISHF